MRWTCTTIRKQTKITQIRHEPSYKQLIVKTNRTSFFQMVPWLAISEYLFCITKTADMFHIIRFVILVTSVPGGTGTVYPFEEAEFIFNYQRVLRCSIFIFLCHVLYIIIFPICLLLLAPLYCLLFFDLQVLITPLNLQTFRIVLLSSNHLDDTVVNGVFNWFMQSFYREPTDL